MIAGTQTSADARMEAQTSTTGTGISQAPPVARLVMLGFAGLLLVLSLLVPFWTITLHAPQYPGGLVVDAYAWKLAGDVSEVDGLNHYIGMMALGDAGALERTLAPFAIPVIAVLAVASHWLRGRKRWLAVAPAIAFPIVFVADLFAWLYHAGHSLDPTAALSSSIKPFTPRLLGEGHIGQFSTVANFSYGFYLVLVAVLVIVAATLLGRSADAREQ
jgi:copper chaperone NosL